MYSNKTSAGLFTQDNSFTPFNFKIGLIKCLIHRAFKINKKKNILQKNMCPIFVINNHIKRFLEMQYTIISNKNTINNNKKLNFKLLYIGTSQTQPKLCLNKFVISIVKH